MKIAIDAREAFRPKRAGKGQWTKGFLDELQTRDIDLTVYDDASFSEGFRWHFQAARAIRDGGYDIYISPTSFIVPRILGQRTPCIPIIHDLIAFQGEPHNRKAKVIERMLLSSVLKTAQHVCTISGSTKEDLTAQFNIEQGRISVIHAGPMQQDVQAAQPDGQSILCVATLCPRKNQLRLMRAFASLPAPLREKYRLVLAGGRGWQDSDIVRTAESIKGVEWKGYVTDDAYQKLLSTATVFAFPSLYEGFGIPVLDALQRGIPVLTSDRASLKEVAGDAALVVDPEDERSIASGLIALLEHEDVRSKLSELGPKQAANFSWKKTVDLFLEALQKAV